MHQALGPIGRIELSFEGQFTRFGNPVKPWQGGEDSFQKLPRLHLYRLIVQTAQFHTGFLQFIQLGFIKTCQVINRQRPEFRQANQRA